MKRHSAVLLLLLVGTVSVLGEVLYAQVGSQVVIPCPGAVGSPRTLEWHYNNTKILTQDRSGGIMKGQGTLISSRARLIGSSLRIDGVRTGEGGDYQCVFNNKKTEQKLDLFTVSAQPPSPILQLSQLVLRCQAEVGILPRVTWQWPSKDRIETTTDGTLTISDVGPSHIGTWTCLIGDKVMGSTYINILGFQPQPQHILSVKEGVSVPLPCLLISPFPSHSSSLTFMTGGWQGPCHQPLLTLQTHASQLKWNSSNSSQSLLSFPTEALTNNLTIILKKVKAQDSGQYSCFLKFQQGVINSTISLEVEVWRGSGTDTKTGSTSVLQMPLWIILCIVVGGVLLLSLLILTGVMWRKKRRLKRLRKRRSQKQPLTARDYCQCHRNVANGNARRQRERERGSGSLKKPKQAS
ncbi:T-cell surface glycoprotein CD4 isoform X2 [Amia ocellicauda]|uniref:T-cell surface glycoprotein CD4 isoform X2 n=1 Tax=Amia ocellicauda TaxID=2972642 RepID=UPI003464C5E1